MIIRNYIRGDIRRNKKSYRSARLSIFLGVLILSTFVFGVFSYYESFKNMLARNTSGYHLRITSPLVTEDIRDLKANRHIKKIGLTDSYMSQEGLGSKSTTRVMKVDENVVTSLRGVLKDGEIPSLGQVLISSNLSKDLGKYPGDSLEFESDTYLISGTYYDKTYDYEDQYEIFIHKSQEDLIGSERPLSAFIWFKNIFKSYQISEKLMENLKTEEVSYNYNSLYLDKSFVFSKESSLFQDHLSQLGVVFLFIILLLVFYSIISNLFYSLEARSIKDYSLLRSLGARSKDIDKLIGIKSFYLGLGPILSGLGLSLVLIKLLFTTIRRVEKSFNLKSGFLIGNYLDLNFSWEIFLFLFLLGISLVYLASKKPIRLMKKKTILEGLRGDLGIRGHKKYDLNYKGDISRDLASQFYKNSRKSFRLTFLSLNFGFFLLAFVMVVLTHYSLGERYNYVDRYRTYNIQGEFASLGSVDENFLKDLRDLDLEDGINFRNESVYLDYDRGLLSEDYLKSPSLLSLEEKIGSLDNIKISLIGLEDNIFNDLVRGIGLRPEDYKGARVVLLNTMGDDFNLPLSRIDDIKFFRDDLNEISLSEYGNILDSKGYEFKLDIRDKIYEPLFDYYLKKDRLYAYMPKSEYMSLMDEFLKIGDLDQYEYIGLRTNNLEQVAKDLDVLVSDYFREGNYYINSKADDEKLMRKNQINTFILSGFLSMFFIVVGFSNCYFAIYNLFVARQKNLELYKALGMDRELLGRVLKGEKRRISLNFLWPMPLILLATAYLISSQVKMFSSLELLANLNYLFFFFYLLIIYLASSIMYRSNIK